MCGLDGLLDVLIMRKSQELQVNYLLIVSLAGVCLLTRWAKLCILNH